VLAFASFAPALRQGFVDLDDDFNFVHNPYVRGLTLENLRWMFTSFHVGHYQPLSWVSLALDHHLWGGLEPRGIHFTNLVLHASNAVLLYLLAASLLRWAFFGAAPAAPDASSELRLRLAAAGAALLHAVHPLRTESVAWATERRDLLSGLFLLASVLAYLRAARAEAEQRPRSAWLALALLGYLLSLLSKAWGITLPVVLLALDVYPLRRRARGAASWRRLLGEKLVYVPLAVLCAWLAVRAQGAATAVVGFDEHPLVNRLAQAGYGLAFYVVRTLWPSELSPLYLLEREYDPSRPAYVIASLAVVATTVALVLLRRRWPAGLTAWFIYAVLASPVLGLVQSGAQKAADRYTYLACIPFALLAGAGLFRLAERPSLRRAALAGAGALVLALALASWRQTLVWKDSETLYRRVVEVEPGNYFGQHMLSVVLGRARRYDEAILHAQLSIAAHPAKGNEEARYNLGWLYRATGRGEEALAEWRKALEVAPEHANSLKEVALDHLRRGDVEGAIALHRAALEASPRFAGGYLELAQLYRRQGRAAEEQELWSRALAALPGWPAAHHGLGLALLAQGRAQEAERQLVLAVMGESTNPEFMTDYGRALHAQGRVAEAVDAWRQVAARFPTYAPAQNLLRQATLGSDTGPP